MELANKNTIELKWRPFITPLKFVRFSRLFRVQSTVHCANQEKSSLLQTSNFPAHFPRKCGRNAAFRRSSAGYSITGRAHWPTLSPPYSLLIPRRQFLTTVVLQGPPLPQLQRAQRHVIHSPTQRPLRLPQPPQPLLRRLGTRPYARSLFPRLSLVPNWGARSHTHECIFGSLCCFCVKIAFYCVQIVRAVIEVMMLEQPLSYNVICTGYDKVNTFFFLFVYFEFMEFHYRHTKYNVCFFLLFVFGSVISQAPLWSF